MLSDRINPGGDTTGRTKTKARKQTRRLSVRNFKFFKGNKDFPKWEQDLTSASYMAITFKSQKNGEIIQIIVQHRTPDSLRVVKCCGRIIARVRSIQGSNNDTQSIHSKVSIAYHKGLPEILLRIPEP